MRTHPSSGPNKLDVFQILCLMHYIYKLLNCSICIVNSQLILICKMSNIFFHYPPCTVSSKLCTWSLNCFKEGITMRSNKINDKVISTHQHNKYLLEYIDYMFRPVNRSSSGLQQNMSQVLFRYCDPNIFTVLNVHKIWYWIKCETCTV